MDYKDFLETKQKQYIESGFDVADSDLNPSLFDFQKFIVKRALKAGKYAIFADCGLGKTFMQLEWAKQVNNHTNKPVLILCPLAVSSQTINEGFKFGVEVTKYGTKNKSGIFISNYEQIENIDCDTFGGVVIDESSILKNYSGAYKKLILDRFERTDFKLACTATPSPNDELEIGNHAEFLNIMTSQDMRAVYFTTDKELIKGDKYRLKKHAKKDFYKWISTWAIMISKPSDIGFNSDGYELTELKYHEKQVISPKKSNGQLFNEVSVSATNFNSELRLTKVERLTEVVEIVNNSTENFIIWIKQNEEGEYLKKLIPDAIEVRGSDSPEYKEEMLIGFGLNKFRVLITKTKIAQFGLNYQNCNNQIFASLDFSFEGLYQAIRRSHRFGQKKQVNIYLISTDTMQNVITSIKEKEIKFIEMQTEMREAIIINFNEEMKKEQKSVVTETENYKLILGDCVEETRKLPTESIDYSFFSPPFGALYVFSNDPKDMSNVKNNDEFMRHFRYLVIELNRVIKKGRLVSIHMMQSTTLLGRDGYYSIVDFRGDLIRLFQECGFYFHAENMIRKDPKTAAIRTKNRQLMHGTTKKDSSIVRPGLADYILTFRKSGENEVPIQNDIPFDLWCKIAEPVWIDVEEGDTLDYRNARDNNDERHITPTQLKPIEWCYNMWVNKGETILSPFNGVGSEGVVALKTGRKYIGIELKESYYDISVKNLNSAISAKNQLTLL
jgi:DNA modification methylase